MVTHLAADEVHIWRASLAQPPNVVARLTRLLSDDERHRAACYVMDSHRSQFIASRGIQRDILSRYVGVPACYLDFVYSRTGKPTLGGEAAGSDVTFNVSNSGELALYAVARGRALGVDIEVLRPLGDALTIADRFLSAADMAVIGAAPESERASVFLQRWTLFEARVKALGLTVGDPLHRQASAPDLPGPHEPQDDTALPRSSPVGFTSVTLELGPEYVGALVIDTESPRLRYIDWSE